MLARTPRTAAILASKPAPPKQLGRDRQRSLIHRIAGVLRDADPTPFAFESAARHGIRGSLCLQGWRWADADRAAAEVIADALRLVGAKRPTWEQGQPEWTQPGVLAVERTRCIRCHGPLPEGHWKFCGPTCHATFHSALSRAKSLEDDNARQRAYYAAWAARQPEQPCEGCGTMFRPKRPGRRFCGKDCSNRHNSPRQADPPLYRRRD